MSEALAGDLRAPPDRSTAAERTGVALRASAACEIAIVTERAAFEALASEWGALFDRAARPEHLFQSFDWLSCWATHCLSPAERLRIVTGRRDGRLVMVWPLVEKRGLFGSKLVWMGEPVSQYGDALVDDDPDARKWLEAGWARISTLGADVAVLRKTRGDANASSLLAACGRSCEEAMAPFAQFHGKRRFDEVVAKRNPKTRSSRRRLLRRLQETGDIAFRSGADTAETEAAMRRAFAMKRAWLLRRGLYSQPLEAEETLDFFLAFATRPQTSVACLVDEVLRDGAAVATGLTFACKGAGVGYLLAHDPECDKQGAGIVLAEHIMRSCFDRGLTRYDMLAPYDAYKAEWADAAAPVADWVVGFSPRGRLLARLWSSAARERVKTALKHLPPRLGHIVWPLLRWLSRR